VGFSLEYKNCQCGVDISNTTQITRDIWDRVDRITDKQISDLSTVLNLRRRGEELHRPVQNKHSSEYGQIEGEEFRRARYNQRGHNPGGWPSESANAQRKGTSDTWKIF
jgi:hypothetical protein